MKCDKYSGFNCDVAEAVWISDLDHASQDMTNRYSYSNAVMNKDHVEKCVSCELILLFIRRDILIHILENATTLHRFHPVRQRKEILGLRVSNFPNLNLIQKDELEFRG